MDRTDCFLYSSCSCRRPSAIFCSFSFSFSSSFFACSFSFSCCFFSISTRRLCAVENEFCAKVPRSPLNSLFPRFRSSTCLVLRCSEVTDVPKVDEFPACAMFLSSDRRGRLLSSWEPDDCLRLEDEITSSRTSGIMTADATTLDSGATNQQTCSTKNIKYGLTCENRP